jgi:hypothetical protein
MPIISFTITGKLVVPEGTSIDHTFNQILTPNGDELRIWPVIELNDNTDLNNLQLEDRNLDLQYGKLIMEMEEA